MQPARERSSTHDDQKRGRKRLVPHGGSRLPFIFFFFSLFYRVGPFFGRVDAHARLTYTPSRSSLSTRAASPPQSLRRSAVTCAPRAIVLNTA